MRKQTSLVLAFSVTVLVASLPAVADSGAAHQVKQTTPVKMGTSGGSLNDSSRQYCCGGTLGSLVRYDGVLSILSNNHILARSGNAAAGEDTIQPGLIDVGCNGGTANIVGDFAGNKVPLGSNVDTAISTARSGQVDTTGAIIDVGVPCSSTQNATVGLAVAKSGRTTGYTTGTVQSVNTSVTVQYQKGCGVGKLFNVSYTNQLVITSSGSSFSAGGDSGSLIVSNDGTPNPVGLLFAGNSTQTIANPIAAVVSAYQAGGHTFTFVGNACAAAASVSGEEDGSRAPGGSVFGAKPDPASTGVFPDAAEIAYVGGVKERYETDLLASPGVIGVGVGADAADPSRAAVVVYVNALPGTHPKSLALPGDLEGVHVRIVATEPFVAQ